jgi:hypothetical protein
MTEPSVKPKPKPETENQREKKRALPLMLAAAQRALDRGFHIYPAPYKTKVAFSGSNGSLDALSKQFSERALRRWVVDEEPANPCVRLDRSGLTVLDIDEGLHSVEEAVAWAKRWNLPETYMVVSGRKTFGVHFYFVGVRTLPDVTKTRDEKHPVTFGDDVYGDLKCHGHVVCEGGLHDKTGKQYWSPNSDAVIAPLPDVLHNYQRKKRERLDKDGHPATAGTEIGGTIRRGDIDGNVVRASLRNRFLCEEAGRMRGQGLNADLIYANLKITCAQFCENGEDYVRDQDSALRRIADGIGVKAIIRRLNTTWTVRPVVGDTVVQPAPPRASLVTVLCQHLSSFPKNQPMTIAEMKAFDPMLKTYSENTLRRGMKKAGHKRVGEGRGRHSKWVLEEEEQ